MPKTTDTTPAAALPIAVQPGAPDGAHFMPSGHWIAMDDPKLLTRGDKKALIRTANAADISAIDSGYAVTEGLLTKLIAAWSYPFPVPAQDAGSLDLVPGGDDGALMELIEPARLLLFPKAATPDDHADERSPTEPSGE